MMLLATLETPTGMNGSIDLKVVACLRHWGACCHWLRRTSARIARVILIYDA